jgi:hypothetical protein
LKKCQGILKKEKKGVAVEDIAENIGFYLIFADTFEQEWLCHVVETSIYSVSLRFYGF